MLLTSSPSTFILIKRSRSMLHFPHQPSRRLPPKSCTYNNKMSLVSSSPHENMLLPPHHHHSSFIKKHKICFIKSTSTISPNPIISSFLALSFHANFYWSLNICLSFSLSFDSITSSSSLPFFTVDTTVRLSHFYLLRAWTLIEVILALFIKLSIIWENQSMY